MKRITVDVEDKVHAQFKSKVAAESLTLTEVLTWLIEDYLAGRVKPRPYDRQKGKK